MFCLYINDSVVDRGISMETYLRRRLIHLFLSFYGRYQVLALLLPSLTYNESWTSRRVDGYMVGYSPVL